MNIDIKDFIERMRFTDKKVKFINEDWYVKCLNDYTEFEISNKEENTVIDCSDIEELIREVKKL